MKIKLLIVLALILITALNANSQQILQPFKASQGLPTALGLAKDSGMVNPQLVAIGTLSGEIPMGDFNVTLEFDVEKGTSTAWVYVIKDGDNAGSIRAFGVIRLFVYLGIPLPLELIEEFPLDPESNMPTGWKDSDVLMNLLKQDQTYSKFTVQYSGVTLQMLGLGVNNENPMLELGQPYWIGIFRGNQGIATMTCFVQAMSGETFCLDISSVEYEKHYSDKLEVFPNPAENVINLRALDTDLLFGAKMTICDLMGRDILDISEQLNADGIADVSIPLNNFPVGAYFIKVLSSKANYIVPFMVIK